MRKLPSLQPSQVPVLPRTVRQHVNLAPLVIRYLICAYSTDTYIIRHLITSAMHLRRPIANRLCMKGGMALQGSQIACSAR